jgi:hypothetical protein
MVPYARNQKIIYSPQMWLYKAGKEISGKSIKYGTIDYLIDDCHEKKCKKYNPNHMYYSITFDDGTFNTCVDEVDIILADDLHTHLLK